MPTNLTDKFTDLKAHMDDNLALLFELLGTPTEDEDNKGILTTLYLIPHALGDVNTGIGNMETSLGLALVDIKNQDYYYGELISTRLQDFKDAVAADVNSRLDTIRDLLQQTNRLLLAQHSVIINPPCPCDPATPLLTSPPFSFIDDGDVEMCERTNFYVDWFGDWLNAYTTALSLGIPLTPTMIAAYQQNVRPDATYNSVGAVDGAAVSDVAALQYYLGRYVLERDDLAYVDPYTHWVSQNYHDAFVTMISDNDSWDASKAELQAWYEDLADDTDEGPIARLIYYFFNMGFLRDIFSETTQDLSAYAELCGDTGGGDLIANNVSESGNLHGSLATFRMAQWNEETMYGDVTISNAVADSGWQVDGWELGLLSGNLTGYRFFISSTDEDPITDCWLFTDIDDHQFSLSTTPFDVMSLEPTATVAYVLFGHSNLAEFGANVHMVPA